MLKNILFTFAIILFTSTLGITQTLNIHTTDGNVHPYNLADIDSITFLPVDTTVTYLIKDDFESYTAGTFPLSGGWILKYNGAGSSYQVVTDTMYHSGNKSMQLKGQPGWSAKMYSTLSSTPDLIYFESWVKSPTNLGIYDDRGDIRFENPNEGTWGTRYAGVKFDNLNGNIVCYIGNNDSTVEAYNTDQWYKFKLKFDVTNQSIDFWINDILKVQNLNGTLSSAGYTSLALGANHGHSIYYFDDIKVWYIVSNSNSPDPKSSARKE